MRAGQRLIASDNHEIMLFPLEYINISQDEDGSYSHQGTLAMDLLGWNANGRVLQCPYYAPCTCTCVYHSSYYNVWTSNDMVWTPRGLEIVSFVVMHDDNPPPLGTVCNQGDLLGHTGTNAGPSSTPLTGDHLHLNTANGLYQGWETVLSGKQQLRNSEHIYNICYVNDTTIIKIHQLG